MLDQSLVTIRSGEIVNQADTDGQVLALWLHGRSKHTQRAYSAKAERFLSFVMKPLARVSLGDVQSFADSLTGLAQSSKAQALAAIKSLLAFAHKIGYLPFNVGAALQLPKAKNTLAERILQESEVHSMIALEPSQRNRLILKTLYYGGFRVSELCGLRWRDLQARGEEGQMTVLEKAKRHAPSCCQQVYGASLRNSVAVRTKMIQYFGPVSRVMNLTNPKSCESSGRLLVEPEPKRTCHLIGCATPTPHTVLIEEHPFILSKRRLATCRLRLPAGIFMLDLLSPQASTWLIDMSAILFSEPQERSALLTG